MFSRAAKVFRETSLLEKLWTSSMIIRTYCWAALWGSSRADSMSRTERNRERILDRMQSVSVLSHRYLEKRGGY